MVLNTRYMEAFGGYDTSLVANVNAVAVWNFQDDKKRGSQINFDCLFFDLFYLTFRMSR
jgi:hypothetical protein